MKKQYGTHERCGAFRSRDGRNLVCGRSAGHSVLKCYDPSWDEDGYFIAPERKGFPKIQPLGVRKLTPLASELEQALSDLRQFLDPDDVNCAVRPEIRSDKTLQSYLETWVEGPVSRVLAAINPYFRASEQDREAGE